MASFQQSALWLNTLGEQSPDGHKTERALLREAFSKIRSRVEDLVSNIHSDFREYTIHDITHLDALWGIASNILGSGYALSPTEGFVLGCSFLLHDAGMTLAAYPNGLDDLKRHSYWPQIERRLAASMLDPTVDALVLEMVRLLHAERAAQLVTESWSTPDGTLYKLIDDPDIALKFGEAIGKIAASHWWPHERLANELDLVVAAPPPFPTEWRIDLLKLACALRVADASHLDERRAPGFLWALRHPGDYSSLHWKFQNRLAQPDPRGDALHFSSTKAFQVGDIDAWWQAYDAISVVDTELRRADALLADARGEEHRFSIRRVANAEMPRRLAREVEAVGWLPVDTQLKITHVPELIHKLGGKELYGRQTFVPLRELVQNGIDAIRIREAILGSASSSFSGLIQVRLDVEHNRKFLEIQDNGIGMNEDTILEHLLDFGSSGWVDSKLNGDFPDTEFEKVPLIGKYGIGFFSVFMVADEVELSTRRFDSSLDSGLILHFGSGLSSRPILRKANRSERLLAGGTKVRLWLRSKLLGADAIPISDGVAKDIHQLCQRLFPLSPITITSTDGHSSSQLSASDWSGISNEQLLERIYSGEKLSEYDRQFISNIRPILDSASTAGRAAIIPPGLIFRRETAAGEIAAYCVIVANGIATSRFSGMLGAIEGQIERAARDRASANLPWNSIVSWASEQSGLIAAMDLPSRIQVEAAGLIRALGGDTGGLPVAECSEGFLDKSGLKEYVRKHDEIAIVQDAAVNVERYKQSNLQLLEGVISVSMGVPGFSLIGEERFSEVFSIFANEGRLGSFADHSLEGVVLEALVDEWGLEVKKLAAYHGAMTDERGSDHLNRREVAVLARPSGEEIQLSAAVYDRTFQG